MPAVSSYVLLHIVIELLGSEAVQALLADLQNLTGPQKRDAWEEMAALVAAKVREDSRTYPALPRTPEWRGDLIASIDHVIIVEGDDISAVIFSDQPYAAVQERGTDPYWPDIDALEPWAADKGYSAFAVARAISMSGIEAKWFFKDALEQSEDEIVSRVGQVIAEVMEKEY